MENQELFEKAVEKVKSDKDVEIKRDTVYTKYKEKFKPENIINLDVEEFLRFFNEKENLHWTNLTQNIRIMIKDQKKLKDALLILLDESIPFRDRINKVTGSGNSPAMVKGFKQARISAFLNVASQDRYGVYNKISMKGLSKIAMNPESNRGWNKLDLGERFTQVNNLLKQLSTQYNISLWALDWVWYEIVDHDESESQHTEKEKKKINKTQKI